MILFRLRYGFIAVLLFVFTHAIGQDVAPTIPLFAPLDFSPSTAGAAKTPRINLMFRDQWPVKAGGFRDTYFSYDQFVNKLHGGMGMYFKASRDTNGTKFYKTALSANYSIIEGSGTFRFVPGIEIGFVHGQLDRDNFFEDQEASPTYTRTNYLDVGAGFTAYSRRYMFAVSAQHLNWPYRTFTPAGTDRLNAKLTAVIAAHIPMGGRYGESEVSPMIYLARQGDSTFVSAGLIFCKQHICAGGYYRANDAWCIAAGLKYDRFRIIYSYDITISAANYTTGGGHEISFMFYPFGRAIKGVFPSFELLGF